MTTYRRGRLRRRDAGLRLERGERLSGSRHLLGEARDHATRRVVLVKSVAQLLQTASAEDIVIAKTFVSQIMVYKHATDKQHMKLVCKWQRPIASTLNKLN